MRLLRRQVRGKAVPICAVESDALGRDGAHPYRVWITRRVEQRPAAGACDTNEVTCQHSRSSWADKCVHARATAVIKRNVLLSENTSPQPAFRRTKVIRYHCNQFPRSPTRKLRPASKKGNLRKMVHEVRNEMAALRKQNETLLGLVLAARGGPNPIVPSVESGSAHGINPGLEHVGNGVRLPNQHEIAPPLGAPAGHGGYLAQNYELTLPRILGAVGTLGAAVSACITLFRTCWG